MEALEEIFNRIKISSNQINQLTKDFSTTTSTTTTPTTTSTTTTTAIDNRVSPIFSLFNSFKFDQGREFRNSFK